MAISIFPLIAKIVLRFNLFSCLKAMCLGYGEDFGEFTELVWADDEDLDFFDQESYPKFQPRYL
ncbi:MAG: hypothetical protein WC246_00755 [Candidatus Paceibacterota bacterium]|jgi:hypothetical protein